jgi:hypothetical protein
MVVQQARRVGQEERPNGLLLLLLDAWREQVEQARRGQEAGRSLAQGLARDSADAYEDFLNSILFYYGENARLAEKGAKGHRRAD